MTRLRLGGGPGPRAAQGWMPALWPLLPLPPQHSCHSIQSRPCQKPSDCGGCLGLYTCKLPASTCDLKAISRQRGRLQTPKATGPRHPQAQPPASTDLWLHLCKAKQPYPMRGRVSLTAQGALPILLAMATTKQLWGEAMLP